jgi:hypothetical protein
MITMIWEPLAGQGSGTGEGSKSLDGSGGEGLASGHGERTLKEKSELTGSASQLSPSTVLSQVRALPQIVPGGDQGRARDTDALSSTKE